MRERPLDEVFPWDFIDIGVTKQFMIERVGDSAIRRQSLLTAA